MRTQEPQLKESPSNHTYSDDAEKNYYCSYLNGGKWGKNGANVIA